MGKLIQMPPQTQPYAFSVAPYRACGQCTFVLIFARWKSDENATARRFGRLEDLLEVLAAIGADCSTISGIRRTLEAGAPRTIPKMWLRPLQIELLKSPATLRRGHIILTHKTPRRRTQHLVVIRESRDAGPHTPATCGFTFRDGIG